MCVCVCLCVFGERGGSYHSSYSSPSLRIFCCSAPFRRKQPSTSFTSANLRRFHLKANFILMQISSVAPFLTLSVSNCGTVRYHPSAEINRGKTKAKKSLRQKMMMKRESWSCSWPCTERYLFTQGDIYLMLQNEANYSQ